MGLVCPRCTRVQPPTAVYCWQDGVLLEGRSTEFVPTTTANTFPVPLVFPCGHACSSFDTLAWHCQEHWNEAIGCLRQGQFASFLGNLGRFDLAAVAQDAAGFPDPARGLDQFLARLPHTTLPPPRLQLDADEIALGGLRVGSDKTYTLELVNAGKRLLYGSVASDVPWLTLGEPPGQPQRLFQFFDRDTLRVHILGQKLRAGHKPLEGRLLLESNGGLWTVTVRVQVPVKPFAAGILAGAASPRALGQLAQSKPAEAAPLFAGGAVERWYEDNGWSFPLKPPYAPDTGIVQQFLEAIGLVPVPTITMSDTILYLRGPAEDSIQRVIYAIAAENQTVFAAARSDQPWVQVGSIRLAGNTACIPLTVGPVPAAKPGKALEARVMVTANGQQRFAVSIFFTASSSQTAEKQARGKKPDPPFVPIAEEPLLEPPPILVEPLEEEPLIPLVATEEPSADIVLVPRSPNSGNQLRWLYLLPIFVLLLALVGLAIAYIRRDAAPANASAQNQKKNTVPPGKDAPQPRTAAPAVQVQIRDQPGESAGSLELHLSGAFEPGRLFQITAKVTGPMPNETLTLQLPRGLELALGQTTVAVPAASNNVSTVSWPVRLLDVGQFPIRVQSSRGAVRTKLLTVARPKEP